MTISHRILSYIPAPLRFRVVELKNRFGNGWKRYHYSQSGEDIIIASILRRTKTQGIYVDVGAHHPYRYSNTALLHEQGMTGISIEPDPMLADHLQRTRAGEKVIRCGVGQQEGVLTYYRYADPAYNTFSTLRAKELESLKWLELIDTHEVSVKPLSKILTESLEPHTNIAFLNVDVEGDDLAVLQSNDWEHYQPLTIAVEDHTFDPRTPDASDTYRYLIDKGYVFVALVGFTLIFADPRIFE